MEVHHDVINDNERSPNEDSRPIPGKKDGKTYDVPLRKCIYNAVACNVTVEQVGSFTVYEMTGQHISLMPETTTVCQMVYEMGIISDLQAGSVLLLGTDHNLAFDATSIDGSHINKVHINTATNGSVVLQISQLAGGQTMDYVEHITNAPGDTAYIYAAFHDLDIDSAQKDIYKRISSTFSDMFCKQLCCSMY